MLGLGGAVAVEGCSGRVEGRQRGWALVVQRRGLGPAAVVCFEDDGQDHARVAERGRPRAVGDGAAWCSNGHGRQDAAAREAWNRFEGRPRQRLQQKKRKKTDSPRLDSPAAVSAHVSFPAAHRLHGSAVLLYYLRLITRWLGSTGTLLVCLGP